MKVAFVKSIIIVWICMLLAACNSSGSLQSDTNSSINPKPSTEADNNNTQTKNEIFGEVQPPKICTLQSKKKFVYDLFHDSYLWADVTKEVDYDDNITYPDEETLLQDLRNDKDHFSFIMGKKEYNNFFQAGKNTGFGFEFVFAGDTSYVQSILVLLVYPGSPADIAGLKRSDQITAVDNIDINTIYHDTKLMEHYFSGDDNLTVTATIKHTDGSFEQKTISKREFDVKTVIKDQVVNIDNKKIGYLLFQSFVGTSEAELNQAFKTFSQKGIDELVLDLRYNGGGYVYIANHLASLIGGSKTEGKIFEKQLFNQKYSSYNDTVYFENRPSNALNLNRIFILTTKSSCSASELVINALRASVTGIDVVQIGDATCGKPYAMIGGAYCDKYILPVQMKSVNADDTGDYVDGIAPKCQVDDDFFHDYVDPHEALFAEALYYMKYNNCQKSRTLYARPKSFFSEHNNFRARFGIY